MSVTTSKIEPSSEYLVRFLSDWDYRTEAFRIADHLVAADVQDEEGILDLADGDGILAELVTYLAASKRVALSITTPTSIGVVFTVWKEARRLQPNTAENPTGEDALRAKVTELNWLCDNTSLTWHLYIVDDECPEGSLDVARTIIEEESFTGIDLLRLRDAIPARSLPLSKLASVDQSVKGGALILGLQRAVEDQHDYVMFTDCDNSNNLGQLGLLLEPLVAGDVKAAIGDRRSTRVSHWQESRDSESTANYVLKRVRQLLAFDLVLRDVTCPFKMFERVYLTEMLRDLDVFDFCVDYDILGRLKSADTPLVTVPVVSLDSDAETTWIPLSNASVWLQKLRGWVHVVEKYELPHNRQVADLIKDYLLDQDNILTVLQAGEEGVFLDGRAVTPAEQLNMSLHDIGTWLHATLEK